MPPSLPPLAVEHWLAHAVETHLPKLTSAVIAVAGAAVLQFATQVLSVPHLARQVMSVAHAASAWHADSAEAQAPVAAALVQTSHSLPTGGVLLTLLRELHHCIAWVAAPLQSPQELQLNMVPSVVW